MHTDEDRSNRPRAAEIVSMADARLAQLAEENRRLRQALREVRVATLEMAALACAAAEVPSESGGVWYLGLTDDATRLACTESIQRLLHAERCALHPDPLAPADVVGLGA